MHLLNIRPLIIIFILWLSALTASAQNQNNFWYFGRFAGLDFNQQPVSAVNNGKLNAGTTGEACATISDDFGDLLFYSDGITVWNKQHNVMNNGTGLSGNKSATQMAIVPAADNLFYIFTAGINPQEHLDYSVVDMAADGGLGKVTVKNHQLLNRLVSEKIIAVKHTNGKDIWVIGHATQSNEFYAWLVSENGVSGPVPSFAGSVYSGLSTTLGIGYLKASSDGKTLAAAGQNADGGFLELLNFDASNGDVTDASQKLTGFKPEVIPYGVEFSPSGKLLYLGEYNSLNSGNLYQIKLPFLSSDINISGTILASIKDLGALQLAPDGKIYVSQNAIEYLHVIKAPDMEGAASGFQFKAVDLNGGNAALGLPSYNLSPFSSFQFTSTSNCSGSPTQFKLRTSISNLTNIKWDFGDPSSGFDDQSASRDPVHQFTGAGTFTVTVTGTVDLNTPLSYTAEVTIEQTPLNMIRNVSEKVVLCDTGKADLSAEGATGTQHYSWYNQDKTLLVKTEAGTFQTDILDQNAVFYVSIGNNECEGELKRIDVVYDKPKAVISATNTIIDDGESVTLTANDAVKYEWLPATGLSNTDAKTVISKPTGNITYTLKVTNANGCTDETTVFIRFKSDLFIPGAFTPNNDGINDFWVVKNLDIQDNTVEIFNRYGKMVYNARNYTNNWNGTHNGKPLPAGVYYYIINLPDRLISGNITILR